MEFPAGSFPSDRRWIVRIIIAVILGEAVWTLIVSIMNNVIVPWLGDLMGPSAGLPTSFVQRPYNYPELFVSIFEVCIAGLVAAILNYFVQRPQEQRSKSMKGRVVASPSQTFPEPEKAYSPSEVSASQPSPLQAVEHPVFRETSQQNQNQNVVAQNVPPVVPVPEINTEPVVPPEPMVTPPAHPVPIEKPAPVPAPEPPAAAIPPAKPVQPSQKTVAAKPKKSKEVYYNIVGEPMPSDDD
jgi:large-conductance mechanosensitive channel